MCDLEGKTADLAKVLAKDMPSRAAVGSSRVCSGSTMNEAWTVPRPALRKDFSRIQNAVRVERGFDALHQRQDVV